MEDVEDWAPQIRAVVITMLSLCLISTLLRCYVRSSVIQKALGLDDWMMILATVFFTLFASFAFVCMYYGLGRHNADLTLEQVESGLLYWWLCSLAYAPTIAFARISIGILFLRLTIDRIQRLLIYTVMISSTFGGLGFSLLFVLQCHPVSYYWSKAQDGGCLDSNIIAILSYIGSVMFLVSDLYFAILPMFLIRGMKMDRTTKITLRFILGLACLAGVAIIVRFPFLHYIFDSDFFWNAGKAAVWNFLEPGLAITAGNLAVVRPLFRKILLLLGVRTSIESSGAGAPNPPTVGGSDNSERREKDFDLSTYTTGSISNHDESKLYHATTLANSRVQNSVRRLSRGSQNEILADLRSTVSMDTLDAHGKTTK